MNLDRVIVTVIVYDLIVAKIKPVLTYGTGPNDYISNRLTTSIYGTVTHSLSDYLFKLVLVYHINIHMSHIIVCILCWNIDIYLSIVHTVIYLNYILRQLTDKYYYYAPS